MEAGEEMIMTGEVLYAYGDNMSVRRAFGWLMSSGVLDCARSPPWHARVLRVSRHTLHEHPGALVHVKPTAAAPALLPTERKLLSARPLLCFFFFQAEDGIRDSSVTGVQTCALPI